jgi:rhodanese-related sulfurtransferase
MGVFAFSSQGLKGGPEVTVKEAVGLMNGVPRAVVIDLRERAAFDKDHLPGAISVPSADFKARLESLKLPKVDPVVLYGADDTRVRDATRLLYESGYQGALTLKGGIEAWRAAGQALEKPQAAKPQ